MASSFFSSDLLLLGQNVHAAVGLHGLELFHAGNTGTDGDEVGQHTAEPTGVHVGHAAAVGLSSDGFLSLLLGADEEDGAALLGDVLNEGVGLVKTDEGLLQVDDVDVAAVAEDVRLHLGVPATGLMTEVCARVEQALDADFRHCNLHSLNLCLRSSPLPQPFSVATRGEKVAQACEI